MKLFVTVFDVAGVERTAKLPCDGVELRAELLDDLDLAHLRASTSKPIILTHRVSAFGVGRPAARTPKALDEAMLRRAIDAGINLIDVEHPPAFDLTPYRERIVLSHHDYAAVPDLDPLVREMLALRCRHTKVAATPHSLADNLRLLAAQEPGVSMIGMGERGLYSRVLAPFRGAELSFVSEASDAPAAPGQLTLARALKIYGERHDSPRAKKVFAIAGNPAGHSLSPAIHNALFREKGVPAAYTIASFESFDEIGGALLAGELHGLSVTAPFKEAAFAFANRHGAQIGENARACRAVNTLVRAETLLADNTDVDGFCAILAQLCGRDRKTAAVVGAGGTARSALVALERAGMAAIVYNRTLAHAVELTRELGGRAEPLEALGRFDGEIVIDTTPGGVALPLRPGMALVRASYATAFDPPAGVDYFSGLDLLHAQARRQHELFMTVFR